MSKKPRPRKFTISPLYDDESVATGAVRVNIVRYDDDANPTRRTADRTYKTHWHWATLYHRLLVTRLDWSQW